MARFDEMPDLVKEAMGALVIGRREAGRIRMGGEEIVGKLPLRIRIVEDLGLIEMDAELRDDIVGLLTHLMIEVTDEGLRCRQHRAEASLCRLARTLLIKEILRFEEELLCRLEPKLGDG